MFFKKSTPPRVPRITPPRKIKVREVNQRMRRNGEGRVPALLLEDIEVHCWEYLRCLWPGVEPKELLAAIREVTEQCASYDD